MSFRLAEEIRERLDALLADYREAIGVVLPGAVIEEMGASSVPGALTKGDLDVLVRVPASDFSAAARRLGEAYAIHQPENWTEGFASFKDLETEESEIPVGIQLVAIGGDDDRMLRRFPELLRSNLELVERYNAFKQTQVGSDPEAYIEAKGEFIEGVLADATLTDRPPE